MRDPEAMAALTVAMREAHFGHLSSSASKVSSNCTPGIHDEHRRRCSSLVQQHGSTQKESGIHNEHRRRCSSLVRQHGSTQKSQEFSMSAAEDAAGFPASYPASMNWNSCTSSMQTSVGHL